MIYQWGVFEADLNPVKGAEQKGSRTVLVISNEEYNQAIPNVTVLPLTSTKRKLYPSEVLLKAGDAGQPLESIILAHQIRTISKTRLGKLLSYLNDPMIKEAVKNAIKEHLEIV